MSNRKLGLIVEDDTDFDSFKVIIPKITNKYKFSFQKKVADGKGRFSNKLDAWVNLLQSGGCDAVIAVIDADTINTKLINTITNKYQTILNKSSLQKKLLIIAVFELETWFLYDVEAIKAAFNIKKNINRIKNPESLVNAKEKLRDIIEKNSDRYYSTNDNKKIAEKLNVNTLLSCSSFKSLKAFIDQSL
jgi:hypothetical protein